MKLSHIIRSNQGLLLFFTLITLYASCCKVKNNSNADNLILKAFHSKYDNIIDTSRLNDLTYIDSLFNNCDLLNLLSPTPYKIIENIRHEATKAYSISNSNLNIGSVSIKVTDLESIYHSEIENKDTMKNGIRIYPALINNQITYLLCVSNEYDVSIEKFYYLVQNGSLVKQNNLLTAKQYFDDFFHKVTLYGQPQPPNSATIKSSRYYSWVDLVSYFNANDYFSDISNKANYTLKLDLAYVDLSNAQELFNIYQYTVADKPVDLVGFSVTIEMLISGVTVSLPTGDPTPGYKNAILEIGKPCPPRCDGASIKY